MLLSALHAMRQTAFIKLTSVSMLFMPYCDSLDRRAARLATISSISFKIAPSAATSDELLSNSVMEMKQQTNIYFHVEG